MLALSLAILVAPLVGFVIQFGWGRKLPRQGDLLTIAAIGISLLCSIIIFAEVSGGEAYEAHWNWLHVGGADAEPWTIGIKIDGLTAVMLIVVSLVAFLVHVFSVGYMAGDPKYWWFFAWLQMFSFSMLVLVLAGNLLHLFIGWELVGLSSYKLIGFWSEKRDPANAARKAFITTRIGDLGIVLAIMIIWAFVGSFEFGKIFDAVQSQVFTGPWLEIAGLGLFLGAVGKSAQMPLHVWLPDAMEGPTPVSALIHAATMVAAGVYLIGRMMPMLTPDVLMVVAAIGCTTAIMAGFIALCQNDIKRVLAYSTVSQLGYMFLGLGVGAWHAGLFHLTTHAFFKALMFLGSGSVIHGCHHEQDMRKMGGLLKKMPVTGWTFLIGVLAIAGLPFLSGFYSKDAILSGAYHHFPVLFWIGLAAAVLTAFYMMRLYVMTFLGKPKDEHVYEHAHESPRSMTMPLVILAFFSVVAGWPFLGWDANLLAPDTALVVAGEHTVGDVEHFEHSSFVMALAIVAGLGGLFLGYVVFRRSAETIAALKRPFGWLEHAFANKFWFDELYREVILRPTYGLTRAFTLTDREGVDGIVDAVGRSGVRTAWRSRIFDNVVVDGFVNLIGGICQFFGAIFSALQSGRLRFYLSLSAGVLAIVLLFELGFVKKVLELVP